MTETIPVSVIVTIRNEEHRLPACLAALSGFDKIIVVDSHSQDKSASVAAGLGASVVPFKWNGQYPKKRQWCLETLALKHDWVFFVDADEIVTDSLKNEIARVFEGGPDRAGYFIKGHYIADGKAVRFGLNNTKLALFDRTKVAFPIVDDLDIPGMGEMEGHYQPVLKVPGKLGTLKAHLLHDALDDGRAWKFRHDKYARWEAGMNLKQAWPADPVGWREKAKLFLRSSPLRPQLMFLLSYIVLGGFLDGRSGKKLALSRYYYARMIQDMEAQLRG